MKRLFKHLLLAVIYGLIGSLVVVVSLYLYLQVQRPDLKVWHRAELDVEFRADQAHRIRNLDDYRRLEDALFEQLHERVHRRIEPADQRRFNRYHAGSLSDPERYPVNGNRSFELAVEQPVAGVLLLHGLSDSPYSLQALGQRLHARGMWVVGLRLPGHGTIPAGLLDVTAEDFVAAVRMAVRHLRDRLGPDPPLYLIGYSNGAALAVEYALSVLEGQEIPGVDRLVLLSPAIGVASVAALASWQVGLSELFGLEKLAWNTIEPEFDPFKYNSFTVNAGDQIYRLTRDLAGRLENLARSGPIRGFPPTLVLLSMVDATVSVTAVFDIMLARLAPEGHRLVVFDVNRQTEAQALLANDPVAQVEWLLDQPALPFDLVVLGNADPGTDRVVARTRPAGGGALTTVETGLSWPSGIFSLSHVALPFPPDAPVYGARPSGADRLNLGSITMRGERGVLTIPDNYFLRLRYNPFFDDLAARVMDFLPAGPE